jgi:hypothetical protein
MHQLGRGLVKAKPCGRSPVIRPAAWHSQEHAGHAQRPYQCPTQLVCSKSADYRTGGGRLLNDHRETDRFPMRPIYLDR